MGQGVPVVLLSASKGGLGIVTTKKSRFGSRLEDPLARDIFLIEAEAIAIKRVLAWQIEEARKEKGLTRRKMAQIMGLSQTTLRRLLDPAIADVTLELLERAAAAVGKFLHIELNDMPTERKQQAETLFPDANDAKRAANALRRARHQEELTQKVLGEKLGITQTRVSRIESGNHLISEKMAVRLAKVLNVDYLIFL